MVIAASNLISYLIENSRAVYSIGEILIKPAFLVVVKAVCGEKTSKKPTTVSLSDDTLQQRIVKLSNDIKDKIVIKIKELNFFSLKLDESTDKARFLQLLVYIRLASNNDIKELFLFCLPISTETTGEDSFNVINKFFRENAFDWV